MERDPVDVNRDVAERNGENIDAGYRDAAEMLNQMYPEGDEGKESGKDSEATPGHGSEA